MQTIESLIDEAHQKMYQERTDDSESHQYSLRFLQEQMPHWKRFYLKKNQQKNYFRITKLVPPGFESQNPDLFWHFKFQIWIKGKLDQSFRITQAAFDYYQMQPEWEQLEDRDLIIYKLKPQSPCTLN